MSRTYRTADHYTEWKIRIGEKDSWSKRWDYTDPRSIARMRNGTRSYHSDKIDPRSYKVSSWREYTGDTKVMAKRAARRNAKILVRLESFIIMDEIWQDEQALMWEDYDWYDEDHMGFDFSYSDEAYEYAEQRRREEMEDDYLDYGYDPYPMDWDY